MSGHAAAPVPGQISKTQNLVWDTNTLDWVVMTQPGGTSGGAGYADVWLKTVAGARINPATDESLRGVLGLAPTGGFDELVFGWTGTDVTSITYKLSTVTVATLTLTYTNGNLTGITRA